MWIEKDSSIMINACTNQYNDLAELNSLQAREFANSLSKWLILQTVYNNYNIEKVLF